MGNFINISILIPLLPMSMALLIFILLVSFKRTINRLTKPVSFLAALSLLSSTLIGTILYFKKIEGEVFLSNYLKLFEGTNLALHLNSLIEEAIILFTLIMALVIGLLFYKLPRQKGYVSLIAGISLISSSIIFAALVIDLSVLI